MKRTRRNYVNSKSVHMCHMHATANRRLNCCTNNKMRTKISWHAQSTMTQPILFFSMWTLPSASSVNPSEVNCLPSMAWRTRIEIAMIQRDFDGCGWFQTEAPRLTHFNNFDDVRLWRLHFDVQALAQGRPVHVAVCAQCKQHRNWVTKSQFSNMHTAYLLISGEQANNQLEKLLLFFVCRVARCCSSE